MPTLGFKKRFVEPIRTGVKHHTIRETRKRPIKPGDKLYLYCGLRTQYCFKILPEPQTCTKVQPIKVEECKRCGGSGEICHSSTHYESCPVVDIFVDGIALDRDEKERLAVADGFKDWAEMLHFWETERHFPFYGHIIHWGA